MSAAELYYAHVRGQLDPIQWEALTRREQAGWVYAAGLTSDTADGLRARVEALADDDAVMFRMGCIEHDVDQPDQISDSLRAAVTRIAAEETRSLAAALDASPAPTEGGGR